MRNNRHYSRKSPNYKQRNCRDNYGARMFAYSTYKTIQDYDKWYEKNGKNKEEHKSGGATMMILAIIFVILLICGKASAEENKRQVMEDLRTQTTHSSLYEQSHQYNYD